ncbi:MAG: hypothetical protein ACREXU_07915, partial [Gammaproteobacteria bacterium]
LRIDDQLYREAKAEAARAGVTITGFIEEALRLRLRHKAAGARRAVPVELPTVAAGKGFPFGPEDLKVLAREADRGADGLKLRRPRVRRR